MVKRYTEAEIDDMAAFYEAHGAVKLPGLIEPEWVQKILDAIDAAAARADEPQPARRDLSFGRAEGRMTIRYMWRDVPVVRDFLLRPELAEPIARIVGTEQLRFWFDLTFIHNGSTQGEAGAGTPWHHDIAAFTFKGMQLPSLWMAMTPADADRSRLKFIDGSHKTVPGYYRTADNKPPADGSKDGFLDVPDFDAMVARGEEKILTWDCEPGDAIIIHPCTLHGADGNKGGSHGRRVAITTRWLGDDVRFLPTSFAASQKAVGIAESGLVLGSRPQGEYFPLVWDARAAATRPVADRAEPMSERHALNLNGERVSVDAPASMPLLWALRDLLHLRGTKFGCGIAQCRACTVHLDGQAVPSCVLPVSAVGTRKVVTIEGLRGRIANAVQAAWVELDVPQCGYCQSGQVMGAVALLRTNPAPDDAAIDAAMAPHLCRCGTYLRIRAAIHLAAGRLAAGKAKASGPDAAART